MATGKGEKVDTIEIHLRALADLVNVNSLFTVAVFVGLSFANSEVQSLEVRPECNADFKMSERLVVYEALSSVSSFCQASILPNEADHTKNAALRGALCLQSFFQGNSLGLVEYKRLKKASKVSTSQSWAALLKVHLNIYGKEDFKKPVLKTYGSVMLLLAAWGSILGWVFLVLSMIDVIQIRIGKLSCGSRSTVRSVASLVSIVGLAFIIYVPALMHANFVSMTLESA
ncbi:uncharacterized protein LOC122292228 [Carya illinoinensis]|uniref:uncharacterized protein LOC122292228 n=1 Tax=Carya illinoinensis TaxID=32201 RepID=UPI001C71E666|nr:uncharacterized protein LOC122292228 [Carya illinoinensis]